MADTGTRIPRNTQAPLTFPGTLSSSEHYDQSSVFSAIAAAVCVSISLDPSENRHPRQGRIIRTIEE